MTSCHRFVQKLAGSIRARTETHTLEEAGLRRNLLSDWRKGSVVRLDYAFKVAKHLGVSLDWLADDGLERDPEFEEAVRLVRKLGPKLAIARLILQPEAGPSPAPETPPASAEIVGEPVRVKPHDKSKPESNNSGHRAKSNPRDDQPAGK